MQLIEHSLGGNDARLFGHAVAPRLVEAALVHYVDLWENKLFDWKT